MQIFRLPKRPIFNFNILRDDEIKRMILTNQQAELQNQQIQNIVEEQEKRQNYFEKLKSIQEGVWSEDTKAKEITKLQQTWYPEEYNKDVLQRLVALNQYVAAVDITHPEWAETLKTNLSGYIQYGNVANLSNIMGEGAKQLGLGRGNKGKTGTQQADINAENEAKFKAYLLDQSIPQTDKNILLGKRDQNYLDTLMKYVPTIKDWNKVGISKVDALKIPNVISSPGESFLSDPEMMRQILAGTRTDLGNQRFLENQGITPSRRDILAFQFDDPAAKETLITNAERTIDKYEKVLKNIEGIPLTFDYLIGGGNIDKKAIIDLYLTDPGKVKEFEDIIEKQLGKKALNAIREYVYLSLDWRDEWLELRSKVEGNKAVQEVKKTSANPVPQNTPISVPDSTKTNNKGYLERFFQM